MAFRTQAIATATTPAVALLVQGSSTGQFPNLNGNATDPLPVTIQNNDATNTIIVGGPNVATEGGIHLAPGQSMVLSLIGDPVSDIPYAISSAATPNATVQVGRQ
jgi:hypothetical protein